MSSNKWDLTKIYKDEESFLKDLEYLNRPQQLKCAA